MQESHRLSWQEMVVCMQNAVRSHTNLPVKAEYNTQYKIPANNLNTDHDMR